MFYVFPIFPLFFQVWRLQDQSQIVDLIFPLKPVSSRASETPKVPHSWQNNVQNVSQKIMQNLDTTTNQLVGCSQTTNQLAGLWFAHHQPASWWFANHQLAGWWCANHKPASWLVVCEQPTSWLVVVSRFCIIFCDTFWTLFCHEWGTLGVSEALDDTGLSGKMRSTIWDWSWSLQTWKNNGNIGNT